MRQPAFGQRLKSFRVARGLSQAEVGEPRLTKAFISLLERGAARPSLETLLHLAERLGRPPADLVAALDRRTIERILAEFDARGRRAFAQRRFSAARADFEQLRDLAAAHGVPQAAAAAACGLGESLVELHRLSEAEPLLRAALEDARTRGALLMECRALRALGLIARSRRATAL
jgi:transcriptional regulator with XRE-family HTH domain